MSRYDIESAEGEFQDGAEDGVLKNRLGLTLKQDIDDAEAELLEALYLDVFGSFPSVVNVPVILGWHRRWLGNLYEWAGQLRSVNMNKGGFHFAAVSQLPASLDTLENNYLSRFSALKSMPLDDLIAFLAESHVEFLLIHPFREGNGRVSRLLLDVMSVQAGFQTLDYELWDKHKEYYVAAIQAGVSGEYQYMERLVGDVLTDM